ncbi:MAG: glutathione S-transferase family protein [Pseudomonadota bacterium]
MIRLVATPRSHFSRKIRLLMDHLGIPYTIDDVGNVADDQLSAFSDNPALSVPTLIDRDVVVFESDHIASYLVRTYDPNDSFSVLTADTLALNARAILNAIMTSEVKLILAQRTGLNTEGVPYFQKAEKVIREGLLWLEQQADLFFGGPSYAHFHLVSMWDHLVLFGPPRPETPRLEAIIAKLHKRLLIVQSAPPA